MYSSYHWLIVTRYPCKVYFSVWKVVIVCPFFGSVERFDLNRFLGASVKPLLFVWLFKTPCWPVRIINKSTIEIWLSGDVAFKNAPYLLRVSIENKARLCSNREIQIALPVTALDTCIYQFLVKCHNFLLRVCADTMPALTRIVHIFSLFLYNKVKILLGIDPNGFSYSLKYCMCFSIQTGYLYIL